MAESTDNNSVERRYLLGALSEDESARIEEVFFADDTKFEALEIAEGELIDAYVQKRLSPEDLKRFETRLLRYPRVVERVHFARTLEDKVSSLSSIHPLVSVKPAHLVSLASEPKARWGLFAQQSPFRAAFATSVVLLLVGGGALVYAWLRLRSEFERLASERAAIHQQREQLDKSLTEQRATNKRLAADLERERDERAQDLMLMEDLRRKQVLPGRISRGNLIASILLRPGLSRGNSEGRELTVGAETVAIRLILVLLANDYQKYSVAIKADDATAIMNLHGLEARTSRTGTQLGLEVPATRLPPDDYVIRVSGRTPSGELEAVSDYAFRVRMKSAP